MSTYKGLTPSRRKANDKYLTEKVDSLTVRVPKGQKDAIRAAAAEQGISVNQFVVNAIQAALPAVASDSCAYNAPLSESTGREGASVPFSEEI